LGLDVLFVWDVDKNPFEPSKNVIQVRHFH
jgi:hypothetical protein